MNPKTTPFTITISEAVAALQDGGVGVMPTDTVYGLVARAHDAKAVGRLYALKHRHHKPGTIIAASVAQVHDLGVSQTLLDQVANLWPNPLSIILPVGKDFAYLHQGIGDIAIRVVDSPNIRQVLEQTGPLLTSSANQPYQPGATTIQQAWDYFGDTVDFYVDDGDRSGYLPSTILRLLDDGEIDVLRPGAIKL
jgi:L-threonylcarbamoyladenylate synthase